MPEGQSQATGSTPKYNFGALPSPQFDVLPTKDEKMWAMIIHLAGALGWGSSVLHLHGGSFLIPLIIWLVKKEESPFIRDQGKEVINFQLCALILCVTLFLTSIVTCIGWVFIPLVILFSAVVGIIGAIKASDGVAFRYPVNFRMI